MRTRHGPHAADRLPPDERRADRLPVGGGEAREQLRQVAGHRVRPGERAAVGARIPVPHDESGDVHREPQPLFAALDGGVGVVPRERDLDRRVQFAALVGLDQVAVGAARLRAGERLVLRIGGHEDHRRARGPPDPAGGLDAVDRTFDVDVHQDQIGAQRIDRAHCILAEGDRAQHPIAHLGELLRQVERDDPLVLDDHDRGRAQVRAYRGFHQRVHRRPSATTGNRTSTRVPGGRPCSRLPPS